MLPTLEVPLPTASTFLDYLQRWSDRMAPLELAELIEEAGDPGHVAIFVVDTVNGFYHEGALQSDRVRRTVDPIVDLLVKAHREGVRHFVFTADEHRVDTPEFTDFPVHCIRGSEEAEIIPELRQLPFASLFTIIRKPTISSAIGTSLDRWLAEHPDITHRVVVGDGTDLGVYQMAMHLKLTANARNLELPVIVPAECVDTYDVPEDVARDFGIPAHPAEALHLLFLHHMSFNGIQVVSDLS